MTFSSPESARDVMNTTLEKIAESQARIFILDISGVGVVDTECFGSSLRSEDERLHPSARDYPKKNGASEEAPSMDETTVDLVVAEASNELQTPC